MASYAAGESEQILYDGLRILARIIARDFIAKNTPAISNDCEVLEKKDI